MGAAAPVGLRRMLEVDDGARQIAAELEMRRQLRRQLRRALAIGRFQRVADQAMQLDAASWRRTCAQDFSIERMQELERGRQRPVRPLDRRAFAHEGVSPGQRRQRRFHRAWRHAGAGRDRRRRAGTARQARHLEQPALARIQPIDLTLDGPPDVRRNGQRGGIEMRRSPPTDRRGPRADPCAIKSFSALTTKRGLPSVR